MEELKTIEKKGKTIVTKVSNEEYEQIITTAKKEQLTITNLIKKAILEYINYKENKDQPI